MCCVVLFRGRGDQRAVEAAEMAISSPLLEDIDLAGARGILVNITAGLDMAIGEFEEVGNVVKQFAADDATVVVGTAIDEELEGELRVTVVATGLAVPQQQRVNVRSINQNYGQQRAVAGQGARAVGGAPGYIPTAPAAPAPQSGYAQPAAPSAPPAPRYTQPMSPNTGGYGQGGGNVQQQQYDNAAAAGVSRKTVQGRSSTQSPANNQRTDGEYLDIPAFLRRQAD